LFSVFAGVTLLWLWLDRTPPQWDDAWYLASSLKAFDALHQGGIPGYLAALNSLFGIRAPLIAALPVPFYLLFGGRWHAAFLVNLASMAVLFMAVFRIARHFWNTRVGLFAIAIVGTMPLFYGLARWFMVEYALAAIVAAAFCLLFTSDSHQTAATGILLGIVCGLGMLIKIDFPVYVLPAFLYVWYKTRPSARSLAWILVPCLILAGPWYLLHFRGALKFALAAGFGEFASMEGAGPVHDIADYLRRFSVQGISSYYVCLTVILGGWALLRGRRSAALIPPLLWLLPCVVFLFSGNNDIRYLAPILPAFALLLSTALNCVLPPTAIGNALAILLLIPPFVEMSSVSFGFPLHRPDLAYARAISRAEWPHDQLLRSISAHSSLMPGERKTLLVGSDRASLNANNIELSAVAAHLPFDVDTVAHEKDLNILIQRLRQASFFLYKEGGEPESPAFNPHFSELVRRVREDMNYTSIFECALPDGGVAHILQNAATRSEPVNGSFLAAGLEQAEEFAIDMGRILALTGYSARRTPDSVIVKCRWKCLQRPNRAYWCFTHVIDSNGRLVGQLDHRILGGSPPLQSWRPGDSGIEEITIRLPPESAGKPLRLRFGLYDPPSGDRLRFGPLQPRAGSSFTPADESTALIAPL
jgi:hypothetical protein